MATPTVNVALNDVGERCQLGIGNWGYWLRNMPLGKIAFRITPQRAKAKDVTYISTSDHLTMRDSEDSRIFMNDWRHGAGQVAYLVDDSISKSRFYDSTGVVVSDPGRIYLANVLSSLYSAAVGATTSVPLLGVQSYLYMGQASQIAFSTNWSGAPTVAATSAAGQVNHLATDGNYVYGAVQGRGINRWAIGSGSAGTAWEATKTTPQRLLYANRRLYALDTAGPSLYEVNLASASVTTDFTPPAGWTLMDLCAKRGGSIDAPIIVLARSTTAAGTDRAQRTITWYWDGTTIHDYIALPTGFAAKRILQYQGTIYIYGAWINSDGTAASRVYFIQNDTLGFLADLGVLQSSGYPTAAAQISDANWGLDASGTFVYFSVNAGTAQDIWKYDAVNGGITRYANVANSGTKVACELAVYGGNPWLSVSDSSGNIGLYGSQATYLASGSIDTSDLHLGQPWLTNNWLAFAMTFQQLTAGQRIAFQYSLNQGVTWTPANPTSDGTYDASFTNDGGVAQKSFLLSSSTSTISNPYLRLRFTLYSGAAATTTPSLYSFALKADPQDPSGIVIEAWLACGDVMYQANGGPDWQGGSGQERIYNIINLYQQQALITVMYLAPSATRGKNPTSITCYVDEYEVIAHNSQIRVGPDKGGIEGDVRVVLRQVVGT